MSEFTLDDFKLTELFLGVDPEQYEDIIPSFTGKGTVPISWMLFLNPDDIVTRQEADPNALEGWAKNNQNADMDKVDEYLKEPVGFRTTLPEAKGRLLKFKNAFRSIPYIWSYFRVLEVLDGQLDKIVTDLEENIPLNPIRKSVIEPDKPRSQVKVDEKSKEEKPVKKGRGRKKTKKEEPKPEEDNPFAELENFGFDNVRETSDEGGDFNVADMLMGLDDDLLSELAVAAEYDREKEDYQEDLARKAEEVDPSVMPVIINFESMAEAGFGYRIGRIPVILDRLLHHAEREGRMTRIMQDYLQDIFRDLKIPWRITGLLAEDFVQSDPSTLPEIMLGTPSPFVLIRESFDLKYWTSSSLQSGDERLMYTLTMLPSEEIHRAIRENRLKEISDRIGTILVNTQAVAAPRLTLTHLKESPVESNIWGFRVLILDVNGEHKPATILCEDPETSWEEDFVGKVNLPGVLIDWNVEYLARFQEFSDADTYRIVLKNAKDREDCFQAFARWIRRHNLLYRNRFGVSGTVHALREILEKTEERDLGQLVFDILTNLTELGISDATEVLADESVVNKLAWLYSI